MKRFICFLFVLMFIPLFSFAEDLTEDEKNYLGGWVMYADRGESIYHNTITFLSNGSVVLHTITFKNGKVASDNTSSGIWGGFAGGIIFTLSGKDMQGHIDENGVLFINFFGESTAAGSFVKCRDMSYLFQ